MATPTGFPECNQVLTAPKGEEQNILNLPIMKVPGAFTLSVWELTEDEIQIIAQTGKLCLGVWAGGTTQPPVYVTAYYPGVPSEIVKQCLES